MKIAIIDDDQNDREYLITYIKKTMDRTILFLFL